MLKILLTFILLMCGICAHARSNSHTLVTNYWHQGQISNVLSIAQTRLAQNSNDIAGLVLKMECDLALLDLSNVSNSIWRVYHVGKTIQSTNFSTRFADEKGELLELLDFYKTYPTPQEIESERAKSFLKGKTLSTYLFDALYQDGVLDE